MFTIKVIDKYGDPAYYKRVSIEFCGFWSGFSPEKTTDRKGECHFEDKDRRGTIYVQGKSYGEYQLLGGIIIYMEN